ncbi:MAG: DNA translocase FtsK 4TM domain-containing protein [Emergencia sp.]|nr:DNA translocase FtsK 4TM domain-containing protein [Emergencia sp.]
MAKTNKKAGASSGKTKNTKKKTENKSKQDAYAGKKQGADFRVVDEIWGIIFIAVGIFLFAAVQFHTAGQLGNSVGDFLRGIFGHIGLILPWYLILVGILLFINKRVHLSGKSAVLLFVVLLMLCLLNSGRFIDSASLSYDFGDFYKSGIELESGGLFGMALGTWLTKLTGKVGLYVFSAVAAIVSILLIVNTPVSKGIEKMSDRMEARRELRRHESEAEGISEPAQTVSYAPKTHESQMDLFAGNGRDIKIITPFDDEGPLGRGEQSSKKEKKNSVLKYMSDKNLFGEKSGKKDQPQGKSGYGLSDSSASVSKGFGLDGAGSSGSEQGFGLGTDGFSASSGGYGLDGASSPRRTEQGFGLSENSFVTVKGGEKSYGISDINDMPKKSALEGISGIAVTSEPQKLTKKEASSITLDPSEMTQAVKTKTTYRKPSVNLLNKPVPQNKGNINIDLKMKAAKLEETLRNFHVDARVIQVTQGPAVTRYEIQPNVGVKVNSIVRLADDIALNLEAKSIRIEAPIPGKAAVGIEVENDKINMVTLREIIDSKEFKEAKSKITFAVGKDIAGKAIVADLKGMPHLLIAGSTGSGKSVCINSIITSILYKADPDEVKLVLIDPKVVELGNYNGIPHLLIPVVTEPAKAAAALNWAVAEMTDRYKKFAENQVRDLESYNDTMRLVGETDKVMPQIVIIIDELADLMMAAPSQVEESICRLAQMARAAGMHLIVATQRPSVDIITGVIKANIPSRIAFAVSSQFDSRTILDMSGAEKLVGKGDMLFNPLGMGKPVRVQGTFVSDSEVHNVIQYVKSQVEDVEYAGDVINTIEKGNLSQGGKDDDGDELLQEAIDCVVTAGQASVSMLQRRFRIGYNRAARIVDMMEARGIVGPQDGSRPRQVLLTEDELNEMKNEVENA